MSANVTRVGQELVVIYTSDNVAHAVRGAKDRISHIVIAVRRIHTGTQQEFVPVTRIGSVKVVRHTSVCAHLYVKLVAVLEKTSA